MKTAKRLEHIQEYYFSRKLKELNSLISAGNPIINLGIGSPDIMPPSSVVKKLKKSLDSPVAHKYQGYKGIEPFRIAIKDFYQNNYNVKLDPNNQILPLIGSKEGIMHISLAFLKQLRIFFDVPEVENPIKTSPFLPNPVNCLSKTFS